MTDSRSVANPSPNSNQRRSMVSTVQVGASAAAAVTSAFAASFFGVAGTLIGAAVGSIISTIAGALYADYLGRAGRRIKVVTKDVVIQRVPDDVRSGRPRRRRSAPTDLPTGRTLRPVEGRAADESVALPMAGVDELRAHPEGMVALTLSGDRRPAAPARRWRRPVLAAAAVSLAGFVIAIGAVLTTEAAIGRPVSGGSGGNTFTKLIDSKPTPTDTSDPSDPEVTPTQGPTPGSGGTSSAPDGAEPDVTDGAVTPGQSDTDPGGTDSGGTGSGGTDSGGTDSGVGDSLAPTNKPEPPVVQEAEPAEVP